MTRWIISAALALGLTAAPAIAKTVIKLGTFAPAGSTYHDILLEMQADWERISDGEVTLQIYAGGVTGDETDMIRKMRVGQLHAATLTSGGLPEIDPGFRAFQIPMMFRTMDEFHHVLEEHRPTIDAMLAGRGFRALGWIDVGWLYFFSRKPVSVPDDLKPQPIFVFNGADRFVDAWLRAGFTPRQLSPVDIHTALQSGMLEALSAPPLVALSKQWFALVPHMSDLRFVPMMGALVITDRAWRKIPKRLHGRLSEAAERAGAKMRETVRADSAEALRVMQSYGLTIATLTPEQEAIWRREVRAAFAPMIGRYIDARLVNQIEETLDAYRASH